MLPELWGKHAWIFIHLVTLDYPEHPTESDKKNYYQFFDSLQYVLPCAKCRKGYAQHIKKYPLNDQVLFNRDNLIKWAIDIHNVVNYYNGKPMLSYSEAMKKINGFMQPQVIKNNDIFYIIIIILALLTLLYLIYRFFYKKIE